MSDLRFYTMLVFATLMFLSLICVFGAIICWSGPGMFWYGMSAMVTGAVTHALLK